MSAARRIIHSQQFSGELSTAVTDYQARFRFLKNSDASTVLIFLIFRFHPIGELLVFSDNRVNFIHFFIVSAGAFLPVLYMMLFIGHYSKLGCFVFSRVIPLLHGVGYTMLIISGLQALLDVAFASDTMEFFYYSSVGKMPWMTCQKEWGDDCIGLNEMRMCVDEDRDCLDSYFRFSIAKYRQHHLRQMAHPGSYAEEGISDGKGFQFWKVLDGHRVVYLFIFILLLVLLSDLSIPTNPRILNIILCMFVFLCVIIITTFIFSKDENKIDTLSYFAVHKETIINFDSWYMTVMYFIKNFSLSGVYVVLIGSYLPNTAMADLQGLVVWIGVMFLYTIGEIVSAIMRVKLAHRTNADSRTLASNDKDYTLVAVHFPQFFGSYETGSQMLSCSYFFVSVAICLFRVRLILATMYHTLADGKPVIRLYRFYIRIFSCVVLFFLAFPMCVYETTRLFLSLVSHLECYLSALVHLMTSVSVCYIYGSQTLCDDHHFMYGFQPVILLKLTLFTAPLVFLVVAANLFLQSSGIKILESQLTVSIYALFGVAILPQFIGLLYIATYYLKRQNMTHLLRCEDVWGDPNPNTRKDRIIYHPRKETNYFRRIEVCNHECLRYNTLCPIIIKEEEAKHNEGYDMLKPSEKIAFQKFDRIRRTN